MPATITSTGTFSSLDTGNPTSQGPGAVTNESLKTNRDGVEQKFLPRALNYAGNYPDDVDGMQETMQYIAIFAAAYSISSLAAAFRIRDILKAFLTTVDLTDKRVFTP